ncbi:MAG TPA: hypothetical protein VKT30_17185 [Caulobacteraceae bacterium]|nr:hypothetical protein [Caulobacteraceae bacterium]
MVDVRDFAVLIEDDRYSVSGLRFIQARSEAAAVRIADRILHESSHYHGVEVWASDSLVYATHDNGPPQAA